MGGREVGEAGRGEAERRKAAERVEGPPHDTDHPSVVCQWFSQRFAPASLLCLVGDLSRSQPRADNRVVHVAGSMRGKDVCFAGTITKRSDTTRAAIRVRSERHRHHRSEQEWFRLFRLNWRAKTKDRRLKSRCRSVSWVFQESDFHLKWGKKDTKGLEGKERRDNATRTWTGP